MQDYELTAWLGDTEATDEQRDALMRAADLIAARYPQEDMADSRESAFSGAAMIILGDDSVEGIADQWRHARAAERTAMETLTGAIIVEAQTRSEQSISDSTEMNRMTVRKALGKL